MVAQIDSTYIKVRPSKLLARLLSYALFEGRPLTTKGRWINPIVFGLLWLQCKIPAPRKVRKPIFIIGTGRSGTTVLGIVLSMHKSTAFLNEPKAIWHVAFRQEDLIGSYSRAAARYRLTAIDASKSVISAMHRIYGWYLTCTFSCRVVDKYPELIFRVPFVRAIFPDAKFLFLVRNGWDTCQSIEHWSERLGVDDGRERHDWWGVDKRKWHLLVDQVASTDPDLAPRLQEIRALDGHADMAAVEWTLTMREGIRLREQCPDAVQTVNYEDLASDPASAFEKICEFCDLPKDSTFEAYARQVLRPSKPASPFKLHAAIDAPFRQTMLQLGYEYPSVQNI